MLFDKNEGRVNDRILYQTKPNMILGCKKAIYGVILLVIILTVSPILIKFIGELQVYMISQIKLPLTRYTVIAFFVIILIDVIYIIWQLIEWYSMEYTLTEYKIIIKSGVISTKKNYMPYATIQDINISQNILARLFDIGSVSVFSAYDNNQLEIKNISNPSQIEEIIFSRMTGFRNFQTTPQSMPQYDERPYSNNDYVGRKEDFDRNEYYDDEYESITPITHEDNFHPKRDYEYYPEDFKTMNNSARHTYEYEPYDSRYNEASRNPKNEGDYNQIMDDYSNSDDNYYQNNDSQNYYDEASDELSKNDVGDMSENVIQRHFDKFKK